MNTNEESALNDPLLTEQGVMSYATIENGHRRMYINAIQNQVGGNFLVAPPTLKTLLRLIQNKNGVVFVTIEDSIRCYVLCAVIRALLLRPTVGLSLEVKQERVKLLSMRGLKEKLLQFIKLFSSPSTLSVIPFSVHSEGKKICKNWIYDPAFWDLCGQKEAKNIVDSLESRIKATLKNRNNKKIILYLGTIDNRKGFDLLVHLMGEASWLCQQYIFIAAGPEGHNLDKKMLTLFKTRDGLLINRRLTEEEVTSLQGNADIFWAWYPPYFDQSSGICGRAVQLEKQVIIRADSVAEKILRFMNYDKIISSSGRVNEISEMLMNLSNRNSVKNIVEPKRFNQEILTRSKEVLRQALNR
jgi:hypothetical protein